jgi:predicted PurR-regulated permease PerM
MNKFWKLILPLAVFWLVSISLPAGVDARTPRRAHPVRQVPSARQVPRQGPSDHQILLQLKDGQDALQRQITDLRQSLKDLRQSFKQQVAVTSDSARDANDRLEKQTVQGFQMLGGRIGLIRTLLILIFVALLALLGGAFLVWQRLITLERSLGQRLRTVEQRVSDLREQSDKWVAGP